MVWQWEPPPSMPVGHNGRHRRHSDAGASTGARKPAPEEPLPSGTGRHKRHSLTHIDLLAQLPPTSPQMNRPLVDHVREHGSPRAFGTASAPPARPPPRADPGYPQTRQIIPGPAAAHNRCGGASPAPQRSPMLLHIPRRENNQRGFAPGERQSHALTCTHMHAVTHRYRWCYHAYACEREREQRESAT